MGCCAPCRPPYLDSDSAQSSGHSGSEKKPQANVSFVVVMVLSNHGILMACDHNIADANVEVITDGVGEARLCHSVDALHAVETKQLRAQPVVEVVFAQQRREASLGIADE